MDGISALRSVLQIVLFTDILLVYVTVLVFPLHWPLRVLYLEPSLQVVVLVLKPADFLLHLLPSSIIVVLPFLGLALQSLFEVVILVKVFLMLILENLFGHEEELQYNFLEFLRNA